MYNKQNSKALNVYQSRRVLKRDLKLTQEHVHPSDWQQARVATVFKKGIEVNQQTTGPSH